MRGLIVAAVILTAPRGANACLIERPFSPMDVNKADVVVIGRISQYSAFPDSARFVITVDEVLKGRESEREASHSLHVTMSRWIAGPPWTKPPPGPVLIALNPPAVLVEICGGPFILPVGSDEAQQVRRVLKGMPPPPPSVPAPPKPPEINAVFVRFAMADDFNRLYPRRAAKSEIEGDSRVECIVAAQGRLRCRVISEDPKGYGFGKAAVTLMETCAVLKPGTYKAGDHFKQTIRWRL